VTPVNESPTITDETNDPAVKLTFQFVPPAREESVAAHPDFAIFDSFPGACLSWLHTCRPSSNAAEKSQWVLFRRACLKFLPLTFHEWATHAIAICGWARAYYEQQRRRRKNYPAAVRSLALNWIRIMFRCWKDSAPPTMIPHISRALRRRGSPLVQALTPSIERISFLLDWIYSADSETEPYSTRFARLCPKSPVTDLAAFEWIVGDPYRGRTEATPLALFK
jgi:hypothetical protein